MGKSNVVVTIVHKSLGLLDLIVHDIDQKKEPSCISLQCGLGGMKDCIKRWKERKSEVSEEMQREKEGKGGDRGGLECLRMEGREGGKKSKWRRKGRRQHL